MRSAGQAVLNSERGTAHPYPAHWDVVTEVMADGHLLTPGTMFAVRGVRGVRFRFLRYVTNKETGAAWVDAMSLPGRRSTKSAKYHAFRLEQVRWVRQPRE